MGAAHRAGHLTTPGDVAGATAGVVTLFWEMGVDAATAQGQDNRIDLRFCPFRALAQQHPWVVCGLLWGLLREFVAQVSAGTVDAELTPFVQPTCAWPPSAPRLGRPRHDPRA
jgi:hypothetical protein